MSQSFQSSCCLQRHKRVSVSDRKSKIKQTNSHPQLKSIHKILQIQQWKSLLAGNTQNSPGGNGGVEPLSGADGACHLCRTNTRVSPLRSTRSMFRPGTWNACKNMHLMGKSKEKKQMRVRLRGREFGCVVSSPTDLSSYARVYSDFYFFLLSGDIYTMCPWELAHGCNITTVAQSTNSNASFNTVFLGTLGFYILNGTHCMDMYRERWRGNFTNVLTSNSCEVQNEHSIFLNMEPKTSLKLHAPFYFTNCIYLFRFLN